MAPTREKFATQVMDLLEKRRLGRPRSHVMEAYQRSHTKYAELYKKLAQ